MRPPQPPTGTRRDTVTGERLAQSRLAILDYLQQSRHGGEPSADEDAAPSPGGTSRWRTLREAGRRYWEGHPARLATGLAAPLLSHWGRRHPVAFLALAAGLGAALVMARPWRLISLTGVLVAVLKSPHLASMAMSLLASSHSRARDHDPGSR